MSSADEVTRLQTSSATRTHGLTEARSAVESGLESARRLLCDQGLHVPELDGKLLRPLVAYALLGPSGRTRADQGFWLGALAIQMVHEASLLHDDIVDGASRRRGEATTASSEGVGSALVLGDLYLTGAYRAAARAERPAFLEAFIHAVERTVHGEAEQGRSAGRRVSEAEYDRMVRGKAGALFGAAAVLSAGPLDDPSHGGRPGDRTELGQRLGATYQRIDDLLDYCTSVDTGKPPLQDYRQRKWTWVLDFVDGVDDFEEEAGEVARRLFTPDDEGRIPARAAIAALEEERAALLPEVEGIAPGDGVVSAIVDGWLARAVDAVDREIQGGDAGRGGRPDRWTSSPSVLTGTAEGEVRSQALALGGPERWPAYFGRHAKTFRLASRLFPAEAAGVISGVYAFCRFTDDLVDDPVDHVGPERLRERFSAWRGLTQEAWAGRPTGIPVLDEVIGGAAARGVSMRYPMALLDGVEMDLERSSYESWHQLEQYTFCVAGAVGGWLTQGFGLHDPTLLHCAHSLGHAMQLTNIARDVGEDWERGRVYVPRQLLEAHDLDLVDLGMLPGIGTPMPGSWIRVVEALLSRADAHYARAWPGIHALPGWYRRPVAAAATAYRGIHDEIRRNGYDNLTRRAHTSRPRKLWLAMVGVARSLQRPLRPTAAFEEAGG